MKTAEEWVKGKAIFQVDKTQPDENWIEIVKQIQLDAWKQGMTDAAEIANNQYEDSKDTQYIKACADCCNAIVEVLENKTEL